MVRKSNGLALFTLALALTGLAACSAAGEDLVGEGSHEADEVVEVAESAATARDAEGIWKGFAFRPDVLMVDLLGPNSATCPRLPGHPGCIVRFDFREARLPADKVTRILERVRASDGDESTLSVLFKGRFARVTVNDHRTGTTTVENRFFPSVVYMSPTVKTHVDDYLFLYVEGGRQWAVSAGREHSGIAAQWTLQWQGIPSPGSLVDDALATGWSSPLSSPRVLFLDQVFLRQ